MSTKFFIEYTYSVSVDVIITCHGWIPAYVPNSASNMPGIGRGIVYLNQPPVALIRLYRRFART